MAKDSRLAEIYRQELKSKGLLSALISASDERRKEKMDVRNLLPSTGLTGAAFQKVFGKSYRYKSKKDSVKNVSDGMESKSTDDKLTRISNDTKITAKNSIVLPGMARDMNVMRQNMQQLVRLNGGKPAKGADALFKRANQRNTMYQSLTSTKKTEKSEQEESGGILSTLSSIGGGILGGLGAIGGSLVGLVGSVLGGLGSLLGGAARGILSVISAPLSALGPLGIILGVGAGFILYQISKNIDFEKIGSDFKKILGLEDNKEKSVITLLAEKLNETFNTTIFTDMLNKMNDTIQTSFDKISDVVVGSFNFVSGALIALAKDMRGHFLQFIDEYGTYLIAAAAGGGALALGGGGLAGRGIASIAKLAIANPVAAGLAAAAGVTYYGLSKLAPTEQERLSEGIPAERKRLEATIKNNMIEEPVKQRARERLEEIKQEEKALIEKAAMRQTDNFSNFVNSNTLSSSIQAAGTERQRVSESNDERQREANRYSTKPSRQTSSSPSMQTDESLSGKTFASLTEDQKTAFLEAQRIAEGGNLSGVVRDYNNPGAMIYSPIAAKYGAVKGEKGFTDAAGRRYNFAKFPTLVQGEAAQRALWESDAYRNMSLSEALRKWNGTKEGTAESGSYEKLIANAIGARPTITAATPSSGNAVTPSVSPMESILASMSAATQKLSEVMFNRELQQAASSPVFSGGQMPGAPQIKAQPYDSEFHLGIVRNQAV